MKFDKIKIDRVIIDADGYAVPLKVAKVKPDIVFKRNDNWTLGAPEEFEFVAYELWKSEWVAFSLGEDWIDIKRY